MDISSGDVRVFLNARSFYSIHHSPDPGARTTWWTGCSPEYPHRRLRTCDRCGNRLAALFEIIPTQYTVMKLAGAVYLICVFLAETLRSMFNNSETSVTIVNRIGGGIPIALGVSLATGKKRTARFKDEYKLNIRNALIIAALCFSRLAAGDDSVEWPFDQAENVATLTTNQVLNEGLPILEVIHYKDDHSWAFLCGTTNKTEDLKLVAMSQIVSKDATLYSIADLPPGWSATRESVDSEWIRTKDE